MSKQVILLTNLGSPDSTSVKDVRRYLNEFLMDKRVIDLPYLRRLFLVRGIITPARAPKSAEKYRTIWTDEGSPLIIITNELAKKVEQKSQLPTYVSMRYANPTPSSAFKKIVEENPDVEEVVFVPLYPHYAMSSYETAVEHVKSAYRKGKYNFDLKVVGPYYNDAKYISSLASSMKPFLEDVKYDHVLFSYHGVPVSHILKGDITGNHCLKTENCCSVASSAHSQCYRHQVIETTRLVAKELRLAENKFSISYQSRLGKSKWLTPSTSSMFRNLPQRGVKKLLVVTPAFVSDCLETLEEIHMEGREIFTDAGGEVFDSVPCLNSNDEWVETIVHLVNNELAASLTK